MSAWRLESRELPVPENRCHGRLSLLISDRFGINDDSLERGRLEVPSCAWRAGHCVTRRSSPQVATIVLKEHKCERKAEGTRSKSL